MALRGPFEKEARWMREEPIVNEEPRNSPPFQGGEAAEGGRGGYQRTAKRSFC
jgi:hypothetical protein